MSAAAFEYHAPTTIDEAVLLLGRFGEDAKLLAGGQSLMPMLSNRLAQPAHVIDINRIARAERPSVQAGRLKIPPLMRHVDFEAGVADGPLGTLLSTLAKRLASWPVRVRGTFIGAVAQGDAAGTWPLATVVLGAEMVARSARHGVRVIPGARFFQTIMSTELADDEMLVEIQIPLIPQTAAWGFHAVMEHAHRYPLALSLVVIEREAETIARARVGIAGIEATPRRLPNVEALLQSKEPTALVLRAAAAAAKATVMPLASGPAETAFQRDLAEAAVLTALRNAVAEA